MYSNNIHTGYDKPVCPFVCQTYLQLVCDYYMHLWVQCTAICIPAIMAKYARLSARHTYDRATGMPGTQGMQGSEEGPRLSAWRAYLPSSAGNAWHPRGICGPSRMIPRTMTCMSCFIFNRVITFFGWSFKMRYTIHGQDFLFMLAWHNCIFILTIVICITVAIVLKVMLHGKVKTRKS